MLQQSSDLLVGMTLTVFGSVPSCEVTLKMDAANRQTE